MYNGHHDYHSDGHTVIGSGLTHADEETING
jgi:hypothetical protein